MISMIMGQYHPMDDGFYEQIMGKYHPICDYIIIEFILYEDIIKSLLFL